MYKTEFREEYDITNYFTQNGNKFTSEQDIWRNRHLYKTNDSILDPKERKIMKLESNYSGYSTFSYNYSDPVNGILSLKYKF